MMIIISGSGELIEAAKIDGFVARSLFREASITICTFLTLTNGNFDQEPGADQWDFDHAEAQYLQPFYGRAGYEGVGQAKAVIFSDRWSAAVIQNRMTRSKEGAAVVNKN